MHLADRLITDHYGASISSTDIKLMLQVVYRHHYTRAVPNILPVGANIEYHAQSVHEISKRSADTELVFAVY